MCVGVLVCGASAANAAPITPTLEGCVTSLPEEGAIWTSSQHFQMVAFWDPVSGCDETIAIPIVLHEWFENFDGLGGLMTITRFDWFPKCGRIQFDAHSYLARDVLDPMGLKSLVFDTGVDCVFEARHYWPSTPPSPAPIPEPSTILLVTAALVILRLRQLF